MIYRLGFWIGPPQAGAEAACADFHTRLLVAEELWTTFDRPPPPVPRIRRFAEAVLEAIPEDLSDESCPWKYHDVAADAVADTFMPMLRGPHREAIGVLTLLAHEHGLQAIDLAAHQILSTADVDLRDGKPWTSARLGGGWDEPEYFDCRGPEIARERLGLPPVSLDGDEEHEGIDEDDVDEDQESLEERGSASRDGAVR